MPEPGHSHGPGGGRIWRRCSRLQQYSGKIRPSLHPRDQLKYIDNDKTSVLEKLPAKIFTATVCLFDAISLVITFVGCFLRVAIGRCM